MSLREDVFRAFIAWPCLKNMWNTGSPDATSENAKTSKTARSLLSPVLGCMPFPTS